MLNRRFTPLNLLMISINGMVGSAWLFAPLYAAKIAGPGSLIAWLVGGIITIIIAITFVELSILFPVAGGTAQIPQISHGTSTSFILTWVAWLSALTMAPIEVQAILQYASTYFTSLTYINESGSPVLTGVGLIWATLLMMSFCIINIASYKGLVRFNFVLFLFKVLVMICVIGTLLHVQFNPSNFEGITSVFNASYWQAILTAVASGGIAFAFTGFKHGVELAGETKQLTLAIPLAIVGSVLVCLLLYLGLQMVFIGALQKSMFENGWQHLSFSGDVGPFAGLITGLGIVWLVKLLYVDAVISPLGAGLIYVTSTARILYAMSQIGYLPRAISYLNQQNFPVVAILINFILGMFLFLPLPGWQAMVSFLVSGMVISYAMGPVALICMRLELPEVTRHFRLPFARFLCPLAFYFCNLLTYWTGWETIYKLAIAMLLGVFVLMIASLRGQLRVPSLNVKSALWLFPYLVGLVLISFLGAFGGKGMIPFGWDFLIIGIFSLCVFYLAVKNRAGVAGLTEEDLKTMSLNVAN